jgi:hypothetical protein
MLDFKKGESTAIECLKKFCQTIVKVYSNEYLRKPNESDAKRLLAVAEERGFPGMMGSLDCMHWCWKNCPVADHGQYTGKEKEPTVVLKAIASYDLWIWHTFFGLPGTLNDINILDRSPIFKHLPEGEGLSILYKVKKINIILRTISPMAFTRHMQHSSNQSLNHKAQRCKSRTAKMLNELLGFYNLDMQSFVFLVNFGDTRISPISCQLSLFCTT